jgi:hypothetical protein
MAEVFTKVLYWELGNGQFRRRHEVLDHNVLRSLGIDGGQAMKRLMVPATRASIEGMEQRTPVRPPVTLRPRSASLALVLRQRAHETSSGLPVMIRKHWGG